jgi:hypothetical protein
MSFDVVEFVNRLVIFSNYECQVDIENVECVDCLLVFVYIYQHFRIILQIRSAYCKKDCHLDQNWQSYIKIFISAKTDDTSKQCTYIITAGHILCKEYTYQSHWVWTGQDHNDTNNK